MVWNENLTVAAILVGSFLIGLVLQRCVLAYLRKLAQKTKWKWDDIVIESLGRMPLLWTICIGGYAVSLRASVTDHKEVIHQVLIILTLVSVTVVVARLVGQFVRASSTQTKSTASSTTLLVNGARVLVYLIGGILILQNLEVKITPILTTLGIGGLAVALALEETLKNLFSGIQIIASEVVRTGDYVKLESGFEGFVTDVKARSTTIRSFPGNNQIIVPNSVVASSIVVNFSLPEENLWIAIDVGVAYDSDLSSVEQITIDVARTILKSVEGGLPDHDPVLRYKEFGDSSINFQVRLFVKRFKDQFLIRHSFIKALHERYKKEGIEIPFPIRTIYHRNAIPE